MNDDDAALVVEHGPGLEPQVPLLDLLDALVTDRGRVAAARALGADCRTVVRRQSRRVSRLMHQALVELRESAPDEAGDESGVRVESFTVMAMRAGADGDDGESLAQWVAAVKAENRGLRETVASRGGQLPVGGRECPQVQAQAPGRKIIPWLRNRKGPAE